MNSSLEFRKLSVTIFIHSLAISWLYCFRTLQLVLSSAVFRNSKRQVFCNSSSRDANSPVFLELSSFLSVVRTSVIGLSTESASDLRRSSFRSISSIPELSMVSRLRCTSPTEPEAAISQGVKRKVEKDIANIPSKVFRTDEESSSAEESDGSPMSDESMSTALNEEGSGPEEPILTIDLAFWIRRCLLDDQGDYDVCGTQIPEKCDSLEEGTILHATGDNTAFQNTTTVVPAPRCFSTVEGREEENESSEERRTVPWEITVFNEETSFDLNCLAADASFELVAETSLEEYSTSNFHCVDSPFGEEAPTRSKSELVDIPVEEASTPPNENEEDLKRDESVPIWDLPFLLQGHFDDEEENYAFYERDFVDYTDSTRDEKSAECAELQPEVEYSVSINENFDSNYMISLAVDKLNLVRNSRKSTSELKPVLLCNFINVLVSKTSIKSV